MFRNARSFTSVVSRAAGVCLLAPALLALSHPAEGGEHPDEPDSSYYHEGDLAGSLRSDAPLPLYDADPQHLWNRLFAAFYTRPSNIPSRAGGPPVARIEGGDVIDFFAWRRTTYWSEPETCRKLEAVLDEFLDGHGERLIDDPLRRAMLQRDLWAPFDHLTLREMDRAGDADERRRRTSLCGKLARVIASLAQPRAALEGLPDNYAAAVAAGRFPAEHGFDPAVDYLPPRLLTAPDEWVEIDFFQPDLHTDVSLRFIALHTREFRGRSYVRIFYRFPGGRSQLEEYLRYIDTEGVDWRTSAQQGSIHLVPDLRLVPPGTEVALVQFAMALDEKLRPTPTRLVESVRLRMFKNTDGADDPATNTGLGTNVAEYTLKRRLLFDGLRQGGLAREPDDAPIYRVIFLGSESRDWGAAGRFTRLARDCRACHLGDGRAAAYSLFSMTNQGGFDAGAQLGVAHAVPADQPSPHPERAARWKERDETYRRLLEHLDR